MTARMARLAWWLPSRRWRNDGWRWRVATLADKLPGQCWADLVSWVFRFDGDEWWARLRGRVPWRPRARIGRTPGSCEADAARCGACYCGKLRAASPPAAETNGEA